MVKYSFDGVIGSSILDPVSLAVKFSSFAVWGCLYKWCLRLYPHRSPEWATRVLTLLHGLLATFVGLSQCDPSCLSSERLSTKCMPHHYALMLWSWGYFAFDLLWCSVYWRDNVLMLSHHVAALMSITLYMRRQYTGCAFACCIMLLEASNPLLQLRWFLRDEGFNQTLVFYLVEIAYLLTFVFCRGVIGTYIVYKILMLDFPMEDKLIASFLYVVSMALMYDVYGYVRHKYKTFFTYRM